MDMEMDRNNDLTDKQIRGIDLVVKSVSKKYPFILGWEFTETWKKYHYHLYINLYVDWKLISEFYNQPLRDFYINYPEQVGGGASLFSYLDFDKSVTTQDSFFEKGYNEGMKIKSLMENLYNGLPEEFQVFFIHKGVLGDDKHVAVLTVDEFIQKK
jgi:hypothetical protein